MVEGDDTAKISVEIMQNQKRAEFTLPRFCSIEQIKQKIIELDILPPPEGLETVSTSAFIVMDEKHCKLPLPKNLAQTLTGANEFKIIAYVLPKGMQLFWVHILLIHFKGYYSYQIADELQVIDTLKNPRLEQACWLSDSYLVELHNKLGILQEVCL